MIKKILIANRGEIAIRIMRSCREMNIKSVAVFSEADRSSRHVLYADEAYPIGPAASQESYLNIPKIIEVALKCGADAIHPGYGFLSENAEFARKVRESGIIFIGPAHESMEAMGDKISARKQMIKAGVPVVPGIERQIDSPEEAIRICKEIGFPVILKASMGGGGKGMRLIREESEAAEAFLAARSEALSSFGSEIVYVEKYIEKSHHIEFQILGDNYGNIIHLCERECSIQRRNQKMVEESPSPFITPALRDEMGKKAVAAAKAVNYVNAGTIEFLVDNEYNFYFLEMNTRLQVEHLITEEVLGLFVQQAAMWSPMLDARNEGWRDAVHTLRGAAAGIGAGELAAVCAEVSTWGAAVGAFTLRPPQPPRASPGRSRPCRSRHG